MRITIITGGSRGDVQPYIALGVGLKKAGHTVCMPAPEIFRSLISESGLEFIPIKSIDPVELAKSMEIHKAAGSKNKVMFIRTVFSELKPYIRAFYDEIWEASKGSEAIISTLSIPAAQSIAEKLGIPCIYAPLLPVHPTSVFHSPFTPGFFNIGLYNRITHKLLEQIVWQPTRSILNSWQKDVLGLKPLSFWGPFREIYKRSEPVLYGYSELVVPKPLDWPSSIHITGYWFLDEPEVWQPPVGLEDFLNAGPPPVYIGFGSMIDKEPERMTGIVLDALKTSGQRGILSEGWSGLGSEKLPDTIFKVGSIPHSWLFRRMSAIVHHGGAGTTAASLVSAIPSIVTPFLGDQPFWGQRVYSLGVGPKPVPYHKLTAENLAGLINTAIKDSKMKSKAKELGERIGSENGVEKAVYIIEKFLCQDRKG